MIGNTFAQWTYPVGAQVQFVYLCARLNPPLFYLGQLWTHLLKLKTPGFGGNAAFARIHGTSNVLDEILPFFFTGSFPHGFPVDPDH